MCVESIIYAVQTSLNKTNFKYIKLIFLSNNISNNFSVCRSGKSELAYFGVYRSQDNYWAYTLECELKLKVNNYCFND